MSAAARSPRSCSPAASSRVPSARWPRFTAICCAAPVPRAGLANCCASGLKSPRRPSRRHCPCRRAAAYAFDHVEFRYPTRPEVGALDDFSLTVEPGERVAVVGPSGAGKSTLFQLDRSASTTPNRYRADGRHRADAGRSACDPRAHRRGAAGNRDLRRHRARQPALRPLGCRATRTLWAAAEAANAATFLQALPQGLDTFIGEGGARLSGGQRQRIAIARAFLRDAPLLLLDEATSALDAESERLVQDALERLMADRTTIVIAHRLATVRAADRIIVMDQGRIVEQGTARSVARRQRSLCPAGAPPVRNAGGLTITFK
jgi:ATP-binding cassette subfamily B protein